MNRLKYFVEGRIFGVCTFLGEKLGIASSYIRLFFIYATFIAITSPIIIYLILAFWINIKKYITRKRNPVWE
ncbi:MAG: PspC domain-containing protein [Chitinophagales bacterium]|jgi:phage shock protein PspC (stress-responsive transcriptional regulator)|nr:PspC domain-containing protein [Chitinophagales bacterium]